MQEIELAGDYYEMGQQYGRTLDGWGFSPQPISDEKREFVRNCEPAVQEHVPELLDELQGVADAGNWDLDLIKAMPLALGYESGCSVVAISGEQAAGGTPLFGRNYDFYTSFAEYSELYRTRPDDRLASVGCSDHWIGRHDGVNEAGLAIGHTFVQNHGSEPGIMFGVTARWVLDTCRTVSEAVGFLGGIPHARSTNFLIADATGEIAIVEASPAEVKTTAPSTEYGVVTNHFVSESMREYEPAESDRSNSKTRHENLTNQIENAPEEIGVDEIQQILADPTDGVCACGSKSDSDPIETLWSWTIVLDSSEAYLADGRPDKNSYEQIRL